MYAEAGRPSSTQQIIREAVRRLVVGSDIGQGYPGDEDNGSMAAWEVFAALGFYPLSLGSGSYTIASPTFDKAKINRGAHGTITINAPGNTANTPYVAGVTVDGQPISQPRLDQAVVLSAGDHTVDFQVSPTATNWGENTTPVTEPSPLVDVSDRQWSAVTLDTGVSTSNLVDNNSGTVTALGSATPIISVKSNAGLAYFTGYTITNGASGTTAPHSWVLEGSADGQTWQEIDDRSNQSFRWNVQTRYYTIANPGAYAWLRLKLQGSAEITLAEIEFLADKDYAPDGVAYYPAENTTLRFGEAGTINLGTARAPSTNPADWSVTLDLNDGIGPRTATVTGSPLGGVSLTVPAVQLDTPGLYSGQVTLIYSGADVATPVTLRGDIAVQVGGSYDISGAFDAVCITNIGTTGASCDGQGWGYGRSLLGYGNTVPWTVGQTITIPARVGPGPDSGNNAIADQAIAAAGMRVWIPDPPIGTPDAITAQDAKFALDLGVGASKLALIGTANEGSNKTGTAKIIYADGFEQPVYLHFGDWCYPGSNLQSGTQVFSAVQTRLHNSGVSEGNTKVTSLYISDPIALETNHGAAMWFQMPPSYANNSSGTLVGGRQHIMAVATDGTGPLAPAELAPQSTPAAPQAVGAVVSDLVLGSASGGRGPLSVSINWGDASTLATGVVADGAVKGSHTYAQSGNYTVTYTLSDGVATAAFSTTVTYVSLADQTMLRYMVNVYNLFDATPASWTVASYAPFHALMEEARALLADPQPAIADLRRVINDLPGLADALVAAVDTAVLDALLSAAQVVLDNPSGYQSAHLQSLAEAVAHAQGVLAADPTQAAVDAEAQALLDALSKVHKLGDKALLISLIEMAGNLDSSQFTPSSWARVAAAVTAGITVRDDPQAAEHQVETAVDTLEAAFGQLVLRAVKAGLGSAISVASSIVGNAAAYVPSSLAGLADALAAAQVVFADDDATQVAVTAAQTVLVTAIAKAKLRVTGLPVAPAGVVAKAAADPVAATVALGSAVKLVKPAVKGKAKVGARLSVKLSAAVKAGVSYQWYRSGKAIKGATKASYKVKAVDKGKRLSVKVKLNGKAKTSNKTKTIR
jgi:hypothetical protein